MTDVSRIADAQRGRRRVPPHNLEAEESLLGSMMLSADAIRHATAAGITGSDFYAPNHAVIYEAILDAAAVGAADPITVAEQLRARGQLDTIGGRKHLLEIQAATPASANARSYAAIVHQLADQRRLIVELAAAQDAAYTDDGSLDRHLDRIRATATTSTGAFALTDLGPILAGEPPEIVPTLWSRDDGHHLLYRGRIASFHAEPSVGKTWIAVAICAEALTAGHTCVYLDWEADAPTLVERLRARDVDDPTIGERFLYARPEGPLSRSDRVALTSLVTDRQVAVVVVDTFASALATEGISEDSNQDVTEHVQTVYRPLARAGAAVILLDHVTKSTEDRGRWARGAGAKLGQVDAAYRLDVAAPYSRTTSGRIKVRLEKDRYGAIGTERTTVADINVIPSDGGSHVTITTTKPATFVTSPDFVPTHAMRAVSDFLQGLGGVKPNAKTIETSINMKAKTIRLAVAELIRRGHIRVEKGARGAILHTLITPYTEPDSTDENGHHDDDEF